MSPDKNEFTLDPQGDLDRRNERLKRERSRFFPGTPPVMKQTQIEGAAVPLEKPYCPFMHSHLGIPVGQQSRLIGGQSATEVTMQIKPVVAPCLRGDCLFWDRQMGRCGVTSLLMYLAACEEEDADESEVETEEVAGEDKAEGGEVPSA